MAPALYTTFIPYILTERKLENLITSPVFQHHQQQAILLLDYEPAIRELF